jgi:hypothetical protein
MSQILVWKCDQTGKLFEDQMKYKSHLRKLARERNTKRKLMVKDAEANAWWAEAYEREMTIDEWRQFVIDNQSRFWAEAAKADPYDWKHVGKLSGRKTGVVCPIPEILEFTEFSVRWNPKVSNSHSKPHNGVTNWSPSWNPDKTAPTSYPGWSGRVEWIVRWPKEWDGVYLGSDLFRDGFNSRVRAYSGTGGGGGMRYSEKHGCHVQSFGYDFKMFAADWPGMARVVGMQQLDEVLKGQRHSIDYVLEQA